MAGDGTDTGAGSDTGEGPERADGAELVDVRVPAKGSERADGAEPGDGPVPVDRFEVARTVGAPAAAIFRLLCSPRGHVAIDSSGMLMSASGEPVRAVGDRFTVHMDREALNDYPLGRYDVDVVITALEPDREIAWTVEGQIRPPLRHVYGYRLQPVEGGTRVTSYYDWSGIDETWRQAGIFPVLSEGALRATLGILARTVQGAGAPDWQS